MEEEKSSAAFWVGSRGGIDFFWDLFRERYACKGKPKAGDHLSGNAGKDRKHFQYDRGNREFRAGRRRDRGHSFWACRGGSQGGGRRPSFER